MSGQHSLDHFDSHPESSGYTNDDFEKLDAPVDHDTGDADSPYDAAGSSHYGFDHDSNQDAEISTTTDNAGIGRTKPEQKIPVPSSTDSETRRHEGPLEQTVFYQHLLAIGTWLKGVDPRESKEEKTDVSSQPSFFRDLIYWRDVKKTAIVFGTMLVVLLSLAIFSLISVVAYLSLAVLTVTFSFVVYKKIMGAVQKSNDGHPFQPLLDLDITLSEDKLKSVIRNVLKNTNVALKEVRRLFLVEDTVDSIKFGLLLWALAYIGSWFNGMSLIIINIVLIFTVPKVYETYQVPIDKNIDLAKVQINNVLTLVQSKVPFLKKKEKTK